MTIIYNNYKIYDFRLFIIKLILKFFCFNMVLNKNNINCFKKVV